MSVVVVDFSGEDQVMLIHHALLQCMKSADKKFKRSMTGSLFAFKVFPDAQSKIKEYCDVQLERSMHPDETIEEIKELAKNCKNVAICFGPEHYHSDADDYKFRVLPADDVSDDDPCTDQIPDKTVTGSKIVNADKYVDIPVYIMKEAIAVMNSFHYLYRHTNIFNENEYHEALQKYRRFISYLLDHSDDYAEKVVDGDIVIMAGFKLGYIHNGETRILEHWE